MKLIRTLPVICIIVVLLSACGGNPPPPPPAPGNRDEPTAAEPATGAVDVAAPTNTSGVTSASGKTVKIKAEVWVDNWFAFYLGETLIKEDSVSITTERSFNKETFTFEAEYPLQLNFIVKDYMKDDTGLECIGTDRQQMGDGGFIAQFTNAETGELIAVTNSNWKGLVIHEAPLDVTCAKAANPVAGQGACGFTSLSEPAGWKLPGFDDSSWATATVYSAQDVGPKQGYEEVRWDPAAQLIWGPNLKTNNIILYRLTVTQP